MTCKCGGRIRVDIEALGGCRGGHSEDEYCYCDPARVGVTYRCESGKCRKFRLSNQWPSEADGIAKIVEDWIAATARGTETERP